MVGQFVTYLFYTSRLVGVSSWRRSARDLLCVVVCCFSRKVFVVLFWFYGTSCTAFTYITSYVSLVLIVLSHPTSFVRCSRWGTGDSTWLCTASTLKIMMCGGGECLRFLISLLFLSCLILRFVLHTSWLQ